MVLAKPVISIGYHLLQKPTDYSFSYGVKDLHTGDIKHQWEKKDGGTVRGHYSLVEADGTIRTVDYTADDKNGFNAIVKHSGSGIHPEPHTKKHAISHNEVNLKPSEYHHYPQEEAHYAQQEQEDNASYQEEPEEEPQYEANQYDGKQQYEYVVPQHEELTEESQRTSIKSTYTIPPNHRAKPKEEYENVHPQQLPIDLSVLKGLKGDTVEQVVPIDVSLIKPVEIDLSKYAASNTEHKYSDKDTAIQPSHELSKEELQKYLNNYLQVEHGFNPIKSKPHNIITQPNVPQTYKTNKKPVTTPGLKNYSSKTGRIKAHSRHMVPVDFGYPASNDDDSREDQHRAEFTNLYRTASNNGYYRYAKRVTYE